MKLTAMLKNFWCDEDGGESAEWPLIIGLIAVGAIGAWTLLGSGITTKVSKLQTAIGS